MAAVNSPPSFSKRLFKCLGAIFVLLVLTGLMLRTPITLGVQGYLYGYPLVIMDVTRAHSSKVGLPENTLIRWPQFPDASFHNVVRPNVDTLYTTSFIDASAGPWVFEMAPNQERYEVMQFLEGWSNVFASLGTRAPGSQGGRYLLVGPDWQGTVPQGLTLMRSPTSIVWLIGRTQTNGIKDFPIVHRLQNGLQLTHLSKWQPGAALAAVATDLVNDKVTVAVKASVSKSDATVPPIIQMKNMTTTEFFTRLNALMVKNPPLPADAPLVSQLAELDIGSGKTLQWGWRERLGTSIARALVDWRVKRELNSDKKLVNGWLTPPVNLGNYGTDYPTRAGVAMVGLGANMPIDAIYPSAKMDSEKRVLDGDHRYRIHFDSNELPPVNAFWSITVYGNDDFFIENPIKRYAIGDRDSLKYNADGSLDLYIQAQAPTGDANANWLPVRAGTPFLLNARLYWPKESVLKGNWSMPQVKRMD